MAAGVRRDSRPGLSGAEGTLELLIRVLKGEDDAIDYVEPFLQQRAESFEKYNVSGGVFEVPKPSQFRRTYAAEPPIVLSSKFESGDSPVAARRVGDVQMPYSPERAGASNVLRKTGGTVAEPDIRIKSAASIGGRGQPSASNGRGRSGSSGEHTYSRSQQTASLLQSRSSGSLQHSGSGIVSSQSPAHRSGSLLMVPSKPASGRPKAQQSVYQEVDPKFDAYNRSYSSTTPTANFEALRTQLSAVIEYKASPGSDMMTSLGLSKTATGGFTSTSSTTLPKEKRLSLSQSRGTKPAGLLDTPMTGRTAASDDSEFADDNAFNLVNDIVDTCVELEQVEAAMANEGSSLVKASPPTPPAAPSAIFSARAAMAAAASAEAASRAAEIAAAASAEAAREASKCVAASRAATGRYNHVVDFVMTDRGDRTMTPGSARLPALECPTGPSQQPSNESSDEEDDPDEGISQEKMEADTEPIHSALDMTACINAETWEALLKHMDLDDEEGRNLYEQMCEAAQEKGTPVDPSVGFTVEEYLEELNLDPEDHEGMDTFVEALAKARQDAANHRSSAQAASLDKAAVRSCFNKVVKLMDYAKIPAKRAWDFVQERLKSHPRHHYISKKEMDVIQGFARNPDEFVKKVEGFMVNPPVMNASGGETACKQICTREVTEIIRECKEKNTSFTDPDWDMRSNPNKVLYVDEERPGWDCTVVEPAGYKRLTTIVKKSASQGDSAMGAMSSLFGGMGAKRDKSKKGLKPMVFKGDVKAGDIIQGQIGTCFLLGAIGAMASHKAKSFEKIFIKYDVDVGVYGVRFNLNGEWRHVIVDDWMPVDSNGELMYARCKDPQEVWVPLLEKAFCKLHTCYEMCDGGEATEALNCFFGGVTGKILVKKHHRKEPKSFFKLLKNARDKGWLLTTSFVPKPGDKSHGNGKCGEAVMASGLVGGHAYSILRIVEALGQQLICCRNPWGSGEWTGKWSDGNQYGEWTAEMKEAVGYKGPADDGKFWMSCEDFVMNCGGVDYARTFGPNWKKVTHYANFASCVLMATAKRDWKGKRSDQLSFSKGDQIVVREIQDDVWIGNHKGERARKMFPGRMVKMNERPVLRFDIVATPNPGSNEPVTAVIMLMQHNVMMERHYKKYKDSGLNYKDTNYPMVEIIVINPAGEVAIRRRRPKRCVWGEVTMPGGGLWRVYAVCASGKGDPCLIRVYIKGGTMTFREQKGAQFSEVMPFLRPDDD